MKAFLLFAALMLVAVLFVLIAFDGPHWWAAWKKSLEHQKMRAGK